MFITLENLEALFDLSLRNPMLFRDIVTNLELRKKDVPEKFPIGSTETVCCTDKQHKMRN
jgi:hypothetical protein